MDDLKCSLQASERQVDSLKKERDVESIESGRRLASLESKVGNVDDSHSFCCSFPFCPGHGHLFFSCGEPFKVVLDLVGFTLFLGFVQEKACRFLVPIREL